jgi:hypothetical protein
MDLRDRGGRPIILVGASHDACDDACRDLSPVLSCCTTATALQSPAGTTPLPGDSPHVVASPRLPSRGFGMSDAGQYVFLPETQTGAPFDPVGVCLCLAHAPITPCSPVTPRVRARGHYGHDNSPHRTSGIGILLAAKCCTCR